jgi:hypothetical protein
MIEIEEKPSPAVSAEVSQSNSRPIEIYDRAIDGIYPFFHSLIAPLLSSAAGGVNGAI